MPHFEPDPTAVQATIEVLEKGEYEFIIGKPKSFARTKDDGGESVGVRYPMTVAEGEHKGAKTFYSCYVATDGGLSFAKQYLMAALGYKASAADEKRFNETFRGSDWGLNTDDGTCGSVWEQPVGNHVLSTVDIGENPKTGEPNQRWVKFRPV